MFLSFTNYENPVMAVIHLLKQLKVKVTDTSVKEAILSHPDYPSLLAISDCLKQWKVENAAIRVEKDSTDEIPLPFIAFTGREFKTVTQITNNEVCFLNDENKLQKEHRDKFLESWSGVALLAEAQVDAGEKEYAVKKRKENRQSFALPALVSFGLLWVIISSFLFTGISAYSGIVYTGLLLCKLTGIIISSLLLWYEIDKYNPTLQKICTGGGSKTNCNAILSSSKAKIFSWLSWSEVGFFYFAGSFLALNLYPQSADIIAWLNIAALPYIVFSLWYQKFIAKQWCPLCLAVQALLAIEFLTAYFGGFIHFPIELPSSILQVILVFLLPFSLWYFIKPHLLKEQEGKTKKYELMRLKNNREIFEALLLKQKKIMHNTHGLGITLGNLNAKTTLVKVCNPYCAPCAKAHPEIERLLEENENLKVQIIFTVSSNSSDKITIPVKHLLAVANKNKDSKTRQALDDWYLSKEKNSELFATKYPLNEGGALLDQQIIAMYNWCESTDIQFTPTFFINSYQLPEIYTMKDLQYLI